MPEVHNFEQRIVVPQKIAITDRISYIDARIQAENAPEFKDTTLANMPRLVKLLQDEKVAKAVRAYWADTISGEFQGTVKGNRIYAVAHGEHPFTSAKRLSDGWNKRKDYGFMPLSNAEAKKVFKDMISIADVRTGYDASNQTIAINLDKDKPSINLSGQLGYDAWMTDDRVLAACGSKENQALLGTFLFKTETKRSSVGSYHRINDVGFGKALGRLLWLGGDDCGIGGAGYDYSGRFVGVAKGEALSAPEAPSARQVTNQEMGLETRVSTALKSGKPFEYNGTIYVPASGVSIK